MHISSVRLKIFHLGIGSKHIVEQLSLLASLDLDVTIVSERGNSRGFITVFTSFHHYLLSDLLSSCLRCRENCRRARRRELCQSD